MRVNKACMSEEIPKQPEFSNHADEKARLECEKLKAEIEAIHKPIFRTPSFYSAIAPVALAIVGLIFTWSSGWFDVQRTRISNEKTLLEAENNRLLAQKEALTSETSKLEASRIALNTDIERLNQRKIQEQQNIVVATNELNQLQRQYSEKEQLIQTLNNEVSKLTKENKELQPLVSKINQLQSERDKSELLALELRSHLATAHEAARSALSVAADTIHSLTQVLGNPDKITDYLKTAGSLNFQIGVWRAAYDNDLTQFKLREFYHGTNSTDAPSSKSQ
jgi:DNA repair exonuclease SbcCD ATPase subunit